MMGGIDGFPYMTYTLGIIFTQQYQAVMTSPINLNVVLVEKGTKMILCNMRF